MRFTIYISPNGNDLKDGFVLYDDFNEKIGIYSSTSDFFSQVEKIKDDVSISFLTLNNEKYLNVKQSKFVSDIFNVLKLAHKDILLLSFPSSLEVLSHKLCNNLKIQKLLLPENLQVIGSECFSGCQIEKIDFPKTLITIREYAFSGNKLLKEVNLEKCSNFKTIGNYAFSGCTSLEYINLLGNFNVSIGKFAFMDCKIKTCFLPEGVILDTACINLSIVKSLRLPETIDKSISFASIDSVINTYPASSNIKIIDFGTFDSGKQDFTYCHINQQIPKNYVYDVAPNFIKLKIRNVKSDFLINSNSFLLFDFELAEKRWATKYLNSIDGNMVSRKVIKSLVKDISISTFRKMNFSIDCSFDNKDFMITILDCMFVSNFLRLLKKEKISFKAARFGDAFVFITKKEDAYSCFVNALEYEKITFFEKKKLFKQIPIMDSSLEDYLEKILSREYVLDEKFEKIKSYNPQNLIKYESSEYIVEYVDKIDKLNEEISDENIISKNLYDLTDTVKIAYSYFNDDFSKNKSLKHKLTDLMPEVLTLIESYINFSNLPGSMKEVEMTKKALTFLITNMISSINFEIENEKMWRQLNIEAQAQALGSVLTSDTFKKDFCNTRYDLSFVDNLKDSGFKITDRNDKCIIFKNTSPTNYLLYLNLDEEISIDLVIDNVFVTQSNKVFFANNYPEIFENSKKILKTVMSYRI